MIGHIFLIKGVLELKITLSKTTNIFCKMTFLFKKKDYLKKKDFYLKKKILRKMLQSLFFHEQFFIFI